MKDKKPDDWFPFWIQKWLWGSTRNELIIRDDAGNYIEDLRGIFTDLMSLAYLDHGFIRANEGKPYPIQQMAGMLYLPVEKLEKVIEICLKEEKLKLMPDGTLFLISLEKYELSERHKRRLEKEQPALFKQESDIMAGKSDIMAGKSASLFSLSSSISSSIKGGVGGKKEEGPLPLSPLTTKIIDTLEIIMEILRPIKAKGFKIHASYLTSLIQEFPEIDHIEQVRKKMAWWNDHPLTKKSNIHLQLLNWFINARKYEAQQKKERMVGQGQPGGPSKKASDNYYENLAHVYAPQIEKAEKAGDEKEVKKLKAEAQADMDKFLKALMKKEPWALEWADK